MEYFKHSELAKTYHVSLKTIHNWIDAARQGKTTLQLHQIKGRTYIANSPGNTLILQQLSEKGKKYRNRVNHKIIHPNTAFYNIYNRRQILDIITNLNTHHEIPRQYNYFKDGANNWNDWSNRLIREQTPNLLNGTIELLDENIDAINRLIGGAKKVNIIDLGVGNGYPVKGLLKHLIQRKVLNRYIAIDISPSMLAIAKRNIKKWYGRTINFEGYTRDLSYERFDDLLVDDMLVEEGSETINLVLLLGATPTNFRSFGDVFNTVRSSMTEKDFLIYTDKPDAEISRLHTDFNAHPKTGKLSPNHEYILNLMNINESFYDVETGFNTVKRMRYARIRLKRSITIKFNFGKIEREVTLEKGDSILLHRIWHMSTLEMIAKFGERGFTALHSSLTQDRQYFLSISAVGTKKESR